MRKGKVAAQVGHATLRLGYMLGVKEWQEYIKQPVAKALRVKSANDFPNFQEMNRIGKAVILVDEGRTQVAPGSKTVMAVFTNVDLNPLTYGVPKYKLVG